MCLTHALISFGSILRKVDAKYANNTKIQGYDIIFVYFYSLETPYKT